METPIAASTETKDKSATASKRIGCKTVTRDSGVSVTVKYPTKLTKPKSKKAYEAEVEAVLGEIRYELLPESTPPPTKNAPLVKEKKAPSEWNVHVAKYLKENPGKDFKVAMAEAKKSYEEMKKARVQEKA